MSSGQLSLFNAPRIFCGILWLKHCCLQKCNLSELLIKGYKQEQMLSVTRYNFDAMFLQGERQFSVRYQSMSVLQRVPFFYFVYAFSYFARENSMEEAALFSRGQNEAVFRRRKSVSEIFQSGNKMVFKWWCMFPSWILWVFLTNWLANKISILFLKLQAKQCFWLSVFGCFPHQPYTALLKCTPVPRAAHLV